MSRRRRVQKEGWLPFGVENKVAANITKLITNVARARIEPCYTFETAARWCWPHDALDKLRAAKPYVATASYGTVRPAEFDLPVPGSVQFNWRESPYIVPGDNGVIPRDTDLARHAQLIGGIVTDLGVVYCTMMFLCRQGTLGALRYYFPQSLALLPPQYAAEATGDTGGRFKEPPKLDLLMHWIRAAVPTLTSALLAPPAETVIQSQLMYVTTATKIEELSTEHHPHAVPIPLLP